MFRTSTDLDTGNKIEDMVSAPDLPRSEWNRQLGKPTHLKNIFYFPKEEPREEKVTKGRVSRTMTQRHTNIISSVGDMPERQIPLDHLYTHFDKLAYCPGCEKASSSGRHLSCSKT